MLLVAGPIQRRDIEAPHQVSRGLELNRKEERRGGTDAHHLEAMGDTGETSSSAGGFALIDIVLPESQSGWIGVPIQEVVILLSAQTPRCRRSRSAPGRLSR